MITKNKLAILGVLSFLLLVFVTRCNRDPKPSPGVSLTPNEAAKVVVDGRRVTVVKRNPDGTLKTDAVNVPRHAEVSISKDGTIDLRVKRMGLCFEPGIGGMFISSRLMMTADFRVAYWRQMGLHVGTGLNLMATDGRESAGNVVSKLFRPYGAIGYTLPWQWASNTSLQIGYGLVDKDVTAGFSIRF